MENDNKKINFFDKEKKIDLILNIDGLTTEEAKKRQREQKNNFRINDVNKSFKDIIFTNLFNLLNLLIMIIATIIIITKHYEQLFFLFINFLNLLISIIQEIKVKKTLDKISLLNFQNTKVIRDGNINSVSIDEIVKGDILLLGLGSQIVADAKIKKGILEINESLLTGESKTVFKKEGDFLYSGSFVISGNAFAEVISIGSDMFISKITREAKKYKKLKTPLIKSFSYLVFFIIVLLLPMSLALFYSSLPLYLTEKNKFLLGFCGFMLGLMPSGLFLLANITLAVGFVKLAQKKAYIKDLFGIEMLARINVLCLDKTGTITDGNMSVKKIIKYKDDNEFSPGLISFIITSFPNNNPTQNALYQKFYIQEKDNFSYKIKNIQHFSSKKKYSSIEIEKIGTFFLGSPEFILKDQNKEIEKDIAKYAILGYRVIVLVKKNSKKEKNISKKNQFQNNYEIISLIVLEDTIKPDVIKTIKYFKDNDVKIKLISGDNTLTIGYIAYHIGIIKNPKLVLDLSGLNKKEVEKNSFKYDVFGRSSPEQKKIIIQTLKKDGCKVGMIGDGVNDILAFKESDISISMASGSEAAKNVSNLVLIDSKFSSLPKVVSEGRRVINNLNKISVLFLMKTILSFLIGIIIIINNFFTSNLIFFPFNPLQFNLIDTFFIGIPSFFLALESNTKKIKGNFIKSVFKKSFPYSLLIAINYFLLLFFIKITSRSFLEFFLIIITALFFLLVLIKSCIPFNKKKIILVLFMLLGFIFFSYLLFFRKIFNEEKVELLFILYKNNIQILFLVFLNILFIFCLFLKSRFKKIKK
ncbi:MAG: cation transport ATPase, P-type [Candidatus Phytoplasma cynodontis]|uniref:HAD-IC family P-type ATPase n=1 Tax='Cynodon dactylon' phytoplasma TaxID=295320 RepID=UPI001265B6A0|nr:HAD-IC family P-type ATPase ['Cynodon dactylon' phytoplasma]KAB8122005.1 HAD-IC family P-type ATPase ['Cynodon dactylon' phytoplasma]WIA07579.1 MAG: cation transport ATPase, P-type [Candidatus Phytoplasma cynodontis]